MAFQHSLRSKQSLILDGGFGQLIADEYPELDIADDGLWAAGVAIRSPEIIRQIHLRYLDAGADIITTATYQASVDGYIGSGLAINEDDAVSLMTKTISLAIDARNAYMQKSNMSCANPSSVTSSACHLRQPLIAVSLGSIGATLGNCSEYTGAFGHELMPSDIKEFHQRRLSVLLKCLQKPYLQNQIDILAFETIPSLVEVDGIVSALEHVHAVRASDIKLPPAWISFTTRTVDQLGSGEPLHVAAKTASSSPYVHAIAGFSMAQQWLAAAVEQVQSIPERWPRLYKITCGETIS
ncbi:hypothetical protein EDC05_001457 [Coemansia umbellata]|uniref:Hcy-binding domain-containing protein n=1 Tax=Coemansia umbellata TaxID=1424467 RepID=A0ABQ8PRR5_9FUNG|nr:hypothetical protein EDC05_001457 [Coemansia umbellata]